MVVSSNRLLMQPLVFLDVQMSVQWHELKLIQFTQIHYWWHLRPSSMYFLEKGRWEAFIVRCESMWHFLFICRVLKDNIHLCFIELVTLSILNMLIWLLNADFHLFIYLFISRKPLHSDKLLCAFLEHLIIYFQLNTDITRGLFNALILNILLNVTGFTVFCLLIFILCPVKMRDCPQWFHEI